MIQHASRSQATQGNELPATIPKTGTTYLRGANARAAAPSFVWVEPCAARRPGGTSHGCVSALPTARPHHVAAAVETIPHGPKRRSEEMVPMAASRLRHVSL